MSSIPSLSPPPTSPKLSNSQPPAPPPSKALTAEQAFDSIGAAYETAFADLPEQTASINWVLDTLRWRDRPARILDVGCGTGQPVCSRFAAAGHSVLGIDVSSSMITAAGERVTHPNATFEQCDVRSFLSRAEQGSFDAITIYFSLIASVTQDEIREILGGLAKLLRPEGLLVFATVPIEAEELEIRWMGRPVVVSSLSVEKSAEAVEGAGLSVKAKVVSKFLPKGKEAGICEAEEVWEEPHVFVYARKEASGGDAV